MSVEWRKGGAVAGSATASLAGAVEVRGHGSGRIRLAVVPDLSAATFARFAEEAITPGSVVLTDGWHSFRALGGSYDHRPTVIGDPKNAAKQLPRVHRAFANLKTWLLGTHHGVGAKHLPHYVDEFVPLQPTPHPHGGVPIPARPDHPLRPDHLPDVVCC